MRFFERLPYAAALGIMCAVLVAGIFVDFRYLAPIALYAAIAIVVVFGGLFMLDYSRRPMVEPPPRPAPIVATPGTGETAAPPSSPKRPAEPFLDPKDEGAFVDPVIEADQLATGEVLPSVVEDDEHGDGSADESPGAAP
jgi:hypothetical protein